MYDWNLFVLYFTVSTCKDNLLINPPPKKNETTKNRWDPRKLHQNTPNFRTHEPRQFPGSQRQTMKGIPLGSEAKAIPRGCGESYKTNNRTKGTGFLREKCVMEINI